MSSSHNFKIGDTVICNYQEMHYLTSGAKGVVMSIDGVNDRIYVDFGKGFNGHNTGVSSIMKTMTGCWVNADGLRYDKQTTLKFIKEHYEKQNNSHLENTNK